MKYKILITILVVAFLLTPVVYAKPDKSVNFPTYEEVQTMISDLQSYLEGLFDGLSSSITDLGTRVDLLETSVNNLPDYSSSIATLDSRVSSLETTVSGLPDISQLQSDSSSHTVSINELSSQLTSLGNRVTALESAQPAQPIDFEFFAGPIPTPLDGEISPTFDANDYTQVNVSYKCTVGEAAIWISTSTDEVNWTGYNIADPTKCKNGGTLTLPLGARYVRFSMGSTTNPSLSVNLTGRFYN